MPAPDQNNELSQLDLVFCVDLTRSMQPFIHQAQQHMSGMLKALSGSAQANLCTALVGYRDYDNTTTPPVIIHPFSSSASDTQHALNSLSVFSPPQNTDAAEAVFAGLEACAQLSFRQRAFKIVILVGDAPPHGCGISIQPTPDRFPSQDPTGHSTESMGALLEGAGITLFSLAMLPSGIPQHDKLTEEHFSKLSQYTGGTYRRAASSQDAIAIVEAIGQKVFGELEFDRYLFEELKQAGIVSPSAPMPAPAAVSSYLAQKQDLSEDQKTATVARLSKRGILKNNKE
jgi:hypothetical protein